MDILYTCSGDEDMEMKEWLGRIRLLRAGDVIEAEVSARGSQFHIVVGKDCYGENYLCVPMWGLGTELAKLKDRFWNMERIRMRKPELSRVDAISLADALGTLAEYTD